MKTFLKLSAIIAAVGAVAACNKDNPTIQPEAVDLGLSVKWAKFNIGAESETDAGSYFAWAETAEKSNYSGQNPGEYKWGSGPDGVTKYNASDGLTRLEKEDDAATAAWGGKWRTPTVQEIDELNKKCEWEWATRKDAQGNDVCGFVITSKIEGYEGNSIFLPAAGLRRDKELVSPDSGLYWSSDKSKEYPFLSLCLELVSTQGGNVVFANRWDGLTIRAVTD